MDSKSKTPLDAPPQALKDALEETADEAAATLDFPPWALKLILSAPALTNEDLGRAACVAAPFRAAADAELRRRWARVRVIGSRLWPLTQPAFEGLEAFSPPPVMTYPSHNDKEVEKKPDVIAYEATMLEAAAWSGPLLRAALRRCPDGAYPKP